MLKKESSKFGRNDKKINRPPRLSVEPIDEVVNSETSSVADKSKVNKIIDSKSKINHNLAVVPELTAE